MKISKTRKVILIVVTALVVSFYLIASFESVRSFLGIPEGETGEEANQRIQNEMHEKLQKLHEEDPMAKEQRELLKWAEDL
jgi:hypothetical protein